MLKVLPGFSYPELKGEERMKLKRMFDAIYHLDSEGVREYLAQGYDPDKCLGVTGWASTNPLNALMAKLYSTRYRRKEEIPTPTPDVAVLNVLMEGGADINRFPFIWYRINKYENHSARQIMEGANLEEVISFVKDSNRLIEAFLQLGADPDKLGHPYPYSNEVASLSVDLTDEEANAYFTRGSRPINEAIKKGMVWESQVDLLLQHTSLDEASLEAAQESNDPVMIGKINRLWIEQR
jgi:hypothetical protein